MMKNEHSPAPDPISEAPQSSETQQTSLRGKLSSLTAQGAPVRNVASRAALVNPDGSTFAGTVGAEILYDAEDGTIVGTDMQNTRSRCLWIFSADGTTFRVDGQPVQGGGAKTEEQWHPPEDPTPEQISGATTLIGFLDRIDAPMDATGWQEPSLEPSEIIDRLCLLAGQASVPKAQRQEARRRAQAILDRARAHLAASEN